MSIEIRRARVDDLEAMWSIFQPLLASGDAFPFGRNFEKSAFELHWFCAARAQGQGIGRALVTHSLAQAREEGFLAMQFNYVVSTNGPAMALYRKLGFNIAGTLPQAFHHRELGLVDAHVLHRFLEKE